MRIPFKRRIAAQAAAFDDVQSEWVVYQGGLGCGKTSLLAYKAFQLSWLNRGIAGAILSPSLPEFKRDLLPMMVEIMDAHIPGARYYSSGKFATHFQFPWTKAPLYVFSAEARLKGPNVGWGLCNEFSSIQYQRIKELIQRKRVQNTPVPQIVWAGTPEDDYGWLDDWTERNKSRIKLYTATSFDNPFNAEGYAQTLMDSLDEDAQQVYVFGKAGRIGKDFFFYAYKPELNDWDGADLIPGETIYTNVDFNVGRMSCSFAHVLGKGKAKQLVFFDEIVLTNASADTEAMGQAIKERYGLRDVLITADASGKNRKTSGMSDVNLLKRAGFQVRTHTANPRIRRSQLLVNGLLSKRRILIHPEKCKTLKRDLMKVRQKSDYEMDKSVEDLTHMSDGLRYLAAFEFPDWLAPDARERFQVGMMGGK